MPRDGFSLFGLPDREQRRRAIVETIHPELTVLGEDLLLRMNPEAAEPLHAHLPRLDWPRGYQPFCTWLALSRETAGYQAGPQLNVGVHADHVAFRLGWDTTTDGFGRFEFFGRHGDSGRALLELARSQQLAFRVYAAAPWPRGSEMFFESADDLHGSFDAVRRRGVWWEVGRRHALPESLDHVCSPDLGREIADVFLAMLPVYDRIAPHHDDPGASGPLASDAPRS